MGILASDVRVVVMCSAGPKGVARRAAMMQQLATEGFQIPCDVAFAVGPSPTDTLVRNMYGDGAWAATHKETPLILAHLLGMLRVCGEFAVLASPAKYLLVLEDDVSLCRNFWARLVAAIETWTESTPAPHRCLRVGTLPSDDALDRWSAEAGGTPWPLCKGRVATAQGDAVHHSMLEHAWGVQGTLFSREGAAIFVDALTGKDAADMRERCMSRHPSPYARYRAPRGWKLVADAVIAIGALNGAVVLPPLVVENDTAGSSIGSASAASRWGVAMARGFVPQDDYFGSPDWPAALQRESAAARASSSTLSA